VFIFVFTYQLYFLSRVFEHDSIAQQKATGTTKGDLRASKGGLYPPWSLMLSPIFEEGCFPLELAID
jgi:hypothetical protein